MDAAKPLEGNLTVTVIEAQGLGKPEVFGFGAAGASPHAVDGPGASGAGASAAADDGGGAASSSHGAHKRKKGKKKAAAAGVKPAAHSLEPEESGAQTPPAARSPSPGGEPMVMVAVTVKNDCKRTAAVRSSDPKWNESFTFAGPMDAKAKVIFSVMNQAPAGNGGNSGDPPDAAAPHQPSQQPGGLMGAFDFDVARVVAGKGLSEWFALKDYSDVLAGRSHGRILVTATWEPAPTPPHDLVDGVVEKLSGPRPDLLRVGYAYGALKDAYFFCAGLPVVRSVAPHLEGVVEGVLSHTPLKPTPEGGEPQKAVTNLDKTIAGALELGDCKLDGWKDWLLGGVKTGKDKVLGLKPQDKTVVQASVDGVKHAADSTVGAVTGTAGAAYSTVAGWVSGIWSGATGAVGSICRSAKSTAAGAYGAATGAVGSTYGATTGAVGSAYGGVKSTAAGAYGSVTGAVGSAYGKATGAVSSAYGGVKSVAGGAVEGVKGAATGVVGKVTGRGSGAPVAAAAGS